MPNTTKNSPRMQRKPQWLKRKLPSSPNYAKVINLLEEQGLHTVCQEAKCPNQWECFSQKTATFLIMGPRCTRNCRFCAIEHGPREKPDPNEANKVARAAKILGLRYVVITSVTRDDLPDGGANYYAEVIRKIRNHLNETLIEVLIPDFQGNIKALETVIEAKPNVLNHNLETIARLYPLVRPGAEYQRSLSILKQSREFNKDIPTKSGLMLGLGESEAEINKTLQDLITVGTKILTLGQYLQPSPKHLPVKRFIKPEEFRLWKEKALSMGFVEVASGPLVRSSYKAHALYLSVLG